MNYTKILFFLFFLFQISYAQAEFYTLKGIVKDPATGEEVIGAQIYIKDNTNKKNVG